MTLSTQEISVESMVERRKVAEDAYGARAVDVVERGYRRMEASLIDKRNRGLVSKAAKLSEAVQSDPRSFPDLMSLAEIDRFQEVSQQYMMDDLLKAVWYILENVCLERRLVPAASIDRETARVVIRLID